MKEEQMTRVRCLVQEGLVSSERIVRIKTSEGRQEEVAVSASQIRGSALEAPVIGREGGKILIELPRESSSGRWRLWVNKDQLIESA
jgi:hypothetical protein